MARTHYHIVRAVAAATINEGIPEFTYSGPFDSAPSVAVIVRFIATNLDRVGSSSVGFNEATLLPTITGWCRENRLRPECFTDFWVRRHDGPKGACAECEQHAGGARLSIDDLLIDQPVAAAVVNVAISLEDANVRGLSNVY